MSKALLLCGVLFLVLFCSAEYGITPHLVQFFKLVDGDRNGLISVEEFKAFVQAFHGDNDDEGFKTILKKRKKDFIADELLEHTFNLFLKYMRNGPFPSTPFTNANNYEFFGAGQKPSLSFEEFEHYFAQRPNFANDKTSSSSVCPSQIHIAYGNDLLTNVVVMWVTDNPTRQSVVQYSTSSSSQFDKQAIGTNYTYAPSPLGWYGYVHKVFLNDLTPDTKYYYQVGSPDCWSSKTYNFTTPTKSSISNPEGFSVALFGDMGTVMPLGFAVTERMIFEHNKTKFDFLLHAGDLSYASTGREWQELEFLWGNWFKQIEPLASNVPYMTAVGNHELFHNFTTYINRFHMPSGSTKQNEVPPKGNFYYSFDIGAVHYIAFCTEKYQEEYAPGSLQYQWLEQDLIKANENRKNIPWILITGHRPMYSSDVHTDSGPLQQHLEPLINKYKVDIALWGHMHEYERTYPVFANNPVMDGVEGNVYKNPKAPVHLTIGTAGAFVNEKWVEPKPSWSAFREQTYGFSRMTMVNRTAIHFQFTKVEGFKGDEFWMIKDEF